MQDTIQHNLESQWIIDPALQERIQNNAQAIEHGMITTAEILPVTKYDRITISGGAHYIHTGNPRAISGDPDIDEALPIEQTNEALSDLQIAQSEGKLQNLRLTTIDGRSTVVPISNTLDISSQPEIQWLIDSGTARIVYDTVWWTPPNEVVVEQEIYANESHDGLTQIGSMTVIGENTHTIDVSGEWHFVRVPSMKWVDDSYTINLWHEWAGASKKPKAGKRLLKKYELNPHLTLENLIQEMKAGTWPL